MTPTGPEDDMMKDPDKSAPTPTPIVEDTTPVEILDEVQNVMAELPPPPPPAPSDTDGAED